MSIKSKNESMIGARILKKVFDYPFFAIIMIFFFVPQPNMSAGSIFRVFLMTTYIVSYLITEKESIKKIVSAGNYEIFKIEFSLLICLLFYEFFLLLSQPRSISNLTYTFRPIYFLLIFAVSIYIFQIKEVKKIVKEIVIAIYIVLFFQYFISLLQLFDVNFLSFFYTDSKSFPLGWLVRLTGTLGNPNIFAWYIGQFSILLMMFETDKYRKSFMIFLGVVFTILTGSRTMLMITPFSWISTYYLTDYFKTKNKSNITKFLVFSIVAMITMALVLFLLKDTLPYAAQLLNIFKGGLSSVNSFNIRLTMWNNEIANLNRSILNLLFGYRTSSYLSVDNDVLYGLTRSGLIGVVLQYTLYVSLLIKLLRTKDKNNFTAFLITSMFLTFVVGLQAETFTGWFYPVFHLLFFGSQNIKLETNVLP